MYHFISYVPINGVLYELDGLKDGPIKLAECSEHDWLAKAAPAIQERIERYAASEIRFNLMAVCKSRLDTAQQQLEEAQAQRAELQAKWERGERTEGDEAAMAEAEAKASECVKRLLRSVHALNRQLTPRLRLLLCRALARLEAAKEQRSVWAAENERRRHNYLPFLFNFLKVLRDTGRLKSLIDAALAKQKAAERGG